MIERTGNLWEYHKKGNVIGITTNGSIRKDGKAVMGRGVAQQCATRYPTVPKLLGAHLREFGNVPLYLVPLNIITIPVKDQWYDNAYIPLIKESLTDVKFMLDRYQLHKICIPRPGCGNGGLEWENVKQAIELMLDDRFVVVNI